LKQQKFTIDAEPSETVSCYQSHLCIPPTDIDVQIAQVKEKIAAEKGWEASQQKLIYSGALDTMLPS